MVRIPRFPGLLSVCLLFLAVPGIAQPPEPAEEETRDPFDVSDMEVSWAIAEGIRHSHQLYALPAGECLNGSTGTPASTAN